MSSDDGSSSSGSDLDDGLNNVHGGEGFIRHTSFDAYFLQASRASKTSNNVFSDVYPPLSREEYTSAISAVLQKHQPLIDPESFRPWFKRYMFELQEGFNLLFYGFGSKREVLNAFAREHCSKRGHVIIVNAYRPDFALKDVCAAIERVPGVADESLPAASIEGQTQRICQFFASKSPNQPAPLYFIIHNIDSAPLRTSKATACLSTLASCPRIHIAASIDHVNAPLLFPLSSSLGRKSEEPNTGSGYAWLWHDLTTLAPYDVELAFADPSSISGASGISKHAAEAAIGADGTGAAGGVAMTETAADHILASVTQRAKKLFILVSRRQLELIAESTLDGPSSSHRDLARFGFAYDSLFVAARDGFIATSDAALRALLGEFRDHGLIVSSTSTNEEGGAGKEVLWVPMRRERLEKVVARCEISA